jgi:hypothetical protein
VRSRLIHRKSIPFLFFIYFFVVSSRFVLAQESLAEVGASSENTQSDRWLWDIGFSVPRFFELSLSTSLLGNIQGTNSGDLRLGTGWGFLPLSLFLQPIVGGFEKSWSDDYNLWIEPRLDVFSWFVFSDWQIGTSGFGFRADFMLQFFRLGGQAFLQNKTTKSASPVIDLTAFYTQLVPGFSLFYSWGEKYKPWRLSLGLSYRAKSYISLQTSGTATLLTDLDGQYREAFDEGLDIAETELSRDLNNISSWPRLLPSLGLTKSF